MNHLPTPAWLLSLRAEAEKLLAESEDEAVTVNAAYEDLQQECLLLQQMLNLQHRQITIQDNFKEGAQYKEMFERIDEGYIELDNQYRFTYANSKIEAITGHSHGSLIGKNIWEAFPGAIGSATFNAIERAAATGAYTFNEDNFTKFDLHLQNHIYPKPDGLSIITIDITAKIKAEQARLEQADADRLAYARLNSSLQQIADYRYALDKSCIISITDKNGIIKHVNERFCIISRYKAAELIGQDHKIINSGHHPASFFANLWSTVSSGKVWKGEIKNKAKDGSFYWVDSTIVPSLDDNSCPVEYLAILYDITERKKTEEALLASNERYDYVLKASLDAIWDWDILEDKIMAGEGFWTQFGYNYADIILTGEDCDAYIHPDDWDRIVTSCRKAINSLETRWQDEYRYRKADGGYAYVSDNAVIIRDQHNRAIRMVGAMRDISDRKKEEARLKLLESVITHTQDMVVITEAEPHNEPGPRILYVNPAFTAITGYSAEEAIGKSPRILQGEKTDRGELNRLRDALAKWQPLETTVINYRKTGEEYWVNFSVIPVADETGWYTHWISIERDVTSQKKAELALSDSYNTLDAYKYALDQADMVFIMDDNGNYLYVNDNFCRATQYSREELIGNNRAMVSSGYHDEAFFTSLWQTVRAGKVWRSQVKGRAKDGSYFWADATITPFMDNTGKPYQYLSVNSDITSAKLAEEALVASNERFQYVTQATFDVIWDWDIAKGAMFYSDAIKDLFGYQRGTYPFKLEKRFFTKTHPADVDRVIQNLQQALAGTSVLWEDQYKVYKEDGAVATVLDRAVIIRDKNGIATRVIGAMLDITEKLEAVQELEKSELKFRSMVHNINDVINMVDEDGFVQYASPATFTVLGFEPASVIGLKTFTMVHPDDYATAKTAFKRLLAKQGNGGVEEFRYRHKDGHYVLVETQGNNQLHNPAINAIIITTRDITGRREKEAERMLLVDELVKKNADLRQFSYITSHNLRAPLTNLVAICNMLDENALTRKDRQDLVNGFKSSTAKLNDTLNDLVKILIIKDTEVTIRELVSFEKMLESVKFSCTALLAASGALVNADFSAAPLILCYRPYMESILLNLLTNSIKYAMPGSTPVISIVSTQNNQQISLVVSDNGRGMNMERVRDKIFGLYQQFHLPVEGRGLGLFLVRAQVIALGGTITVASKENEGTSFTLHFKKQNH